MLNYFDAKDYLDRGTKKLNEKQYREALEDFDRTIQCLADVCGMVSFRRGLVHAQLGNSSKAEVDFNTALYFATETDDMQLHNTIEKALRLLRGENLHEIQS